MEFQIGDDEYSDYTISDRIIFTYSPKDQCVKLVFDIVANSVVNSNSETVVVISEDYSEKFERRLDRYIDLYMDVDDSDIEYTICIDLEDCEYSSSNCDIFYVVAENDNEERVHSKSVNFGENNTFGDSVNLSIENSEESVGKSNFINDDVECIVFINPDIVERVYEPFRDTIINLDQIEDDVVNVYTQVYDFNSKIDEEYNIDGMISKDTSERLT